MIVYNKKCEIYCNINVVCTRYARGLLQMGETTNKSLPYIILAKPMDIQFVAVTILFGHCQSCSRR